MDYFKAILFGFSLAISIGPIAILIINQSVNCGVITGLKSGLGAALADFVYAVMAFLGGHLLMVVLNENEKYFALGSSFALIFFGLKMACNSIRRTKPNKNEAVIKTNIACKKPLTTIFALTVVNPLTIIVFSGLAGQYQELSLYKIFLLAFSVFIGSLFVQVTLVMASNWMAVKFRNNKMLSYLNLISGIAIFVFGLLNAL